MASAWGKSWGRSWGSAWGALFEALVSDPFYFLPHRLRGYLLAHCFRTPCLALSVRLFDAAHTARGFTRWHDPRHVALAHSERRFWCNEILRFYWV